MLMQSRSGEEAREEYGEGRELTGLAFCVRFPGPSTYVRRDETPAEVRGKTQARINVRSSLLPPLSPSQIQAAKAYSSSSDTETGGGRNEEEKESWLFRPVFRSAE